MADAFSLLQVMLGMECVCPSQSLYVEALTLSVTIFVDEAFKKVIKVK
jgi:hypothetical protein